MRCKCCTDENSDIDDIDEIANKCVQQLNAIEEAVNEQEQADLPSTSKVSRWQISRIWSEIFGNKFVFSFFLPAEFV